MSDLYCVDCGGFHSPGDCEAHKWLTEVESDA